MGKRGPKKTPTIILRQRGSWRAGTRENEPGLPVKALDPPEYLSEKARAKWEQLVPILVEAGVLTAGDEDRLADYCETWAELREINEFCRNKGKLIPLGKSASGAVVVNPALKTRIALRQQLQRLGACFGLSPADRADIKAAPKPKEEDAKKRFFKGA